MLMIEMKELPTDMVTIKVDDASVDIAVADPFWLGRTMAMLYKNHNPRIVIGPHCTAPFHTSNRAAVGVCLVDGAGLLRRVLYADPAGEEPARVFDWSGAMSAERGNVFGHGTAQPRDS